MQISVASSSLIARPIIEAILESKHSLASIITHPDKRVGRGQSLAPNELAQWAQDKGLPVAKPIDVPEINKHLLEVQPQIVLTASYGKLIPPELLHGPRYGWLNVHYSLLPRWRGAAPVQWAILEGDEKTGLTIFKLDKGMDTGPIFFQEEIHVGDEATTSSLLNELSHRSGLRIIGVIDGIASGQKPKTQPIVGVTLAPKISKEMGEINWSNPGIQIMRQVRALGERPGTFTTFRGQKLAIHELFFSESLRGQHEIGDIWSESNGIFVQTKDLVLQIGDVTQAGKKRMSAQDFARGARLVNGEKVG